MTQDHKQKQVQGAVRNIIEHIGENSARSGVLDTPKRVAKSYDEIFAGYNTDVREVCAKQFDVEPEINDYVWLKNIQFHSVCEHHMLPIVGFVDICYIPRDKIIGVSKLARIVEVFARQMQVQERITSQIGSTLQENLNPHGVGVRVRAEHFCMSMRGVKKPNCSMETIYTTGIFKQDNFHRREFFAMLKQ